MSRTASFEFHVRRFGHNIVETRELRVLERGELELVKPRFRSMVKEAWARGEEVPFGVTYLDDRKLTEREIKRGIELANMFVGLNGISQ